MHETSDWWNEIGGLVGGSFHAVMLTSLFPIEQLLTAA